MPVRICGSKKAAYSQSFHAHYGALSVQKQSGVSSHRSYCKYQKTRETRSPSSSATTARSTSAARRWLPLAGSLWQNARAQHRAIAAVEAIVIVLVVRFTKVGRATRIRNVGSNQRFARCRQVDSRPGRHRPKHPSLSRIRLESSLAGKQNRILAPTLRRPRPNLAHTSGYRPNRLFFIKCPRRRLRYPSHAQFVSPRASDLSPRKAPRHARNPIKTALERAVNISQLFVIGKELCRHLVL